MLVCIMLTIVSWRLKKVWGGEAQSQNVIHTKMYMEIVYIYVCIYVDISMPNHRGRNYSNGETKEEQPWGHLCL